MVVSSLLWPNILILFHLVKLLPFSHEELILGFELLFKSIEIMFWRLMGVGPAHILNLKLIDQNKIYCFEGKRLMYLDKFTI